MTSVDEHPNVTFKFFSPLRTPTRVAQTSSKKKKKKHWHEPKERGDKSKQHKLNLEKEVTKDILHLASNISCKLSDKSFEDTDSDAVSINFDIPPGKARQLNARISGCPDINKPSASDISGKLINQNKNLNVHKEYSENDNFSLQRKENINTPKMGRKIHDLHSSPHKVHSKQSKKTKKNLDTSNSVMPLEENITESHVTNIKKAHVTNNATNGGDKKSEASSSYNSLISGSGNDFKASGSDSESKASGSDSESKASGSDSESKTSESNRDSKKSGSNNNSDDDAEASSDNEETLETSVAKTSKTR